MKVLLPIVIIFSIFSSCDDQEMVVTSRDFPRLETLTISENTIKGARFNARFRYRGDFEILNYGFIWNETPYPTLRTPSTDNYIVNENIQAETYSVFISEGLIAGETYYVRAFVQTSDYTIYGINQTFKSKGSEN
ncbi:MAG: hypothetical protein KI791_13380 [Cyclobacteriaceae bacterium]|nr:hypothetical protein [Cyclobacteriaceae bacterium SS2]